MRNLIASIILLFSIATYGQGLKTQGKVIVNSTGEEVLLRGLGPGGWMVMEGYMNQSAGIAGTQHEIKNKLILLMGEEKTEQFFERWRNNHFTKRDVDSLAAWGFNSIRLPMHYNLFTLPIEKEPVKGEHTWLSTGFNMVDDLLDWCESHEMYLILDLHAAPGGQGANADISDYDPSKPSLWESEENREKTVALWGKIAEKYKDEEWIGGYDLINEPNWDLPGGLLLRELYEDITQAIREVDSNHIIFIEGNWFANDFTGLTPPWDDNMVYSFHKYWSSNTETDLDWILPMREQYNVPLWMGESGENSNTWYTDAISLLEENDIGWAWWTMRKIEAINSPYDIRMNEGYKKVLNYWKGEGPKPTEEETFDAMMELADNLLVENSFYHKDIIDAMFRQVNTDETMAFHLNGIPGVLHMSDYDLGKNGYAYYDNDVANYHLSTGEFQAWNAGWTYRNDGVDIQKNDDTSNSNGYHVGFVNENEWMKYSVQIAESGSYTLGVRVATPGIGRFYLSVDDQNVTSFQTINSTGGWDKFETIEINNVLLDEGNHDLKFQVEGGEFNISSIDFVRSGTLESANFSILNGWSKQDNSVVTLAVNQSVSSESLKGSEDQFLVEINGEIVSVSDISLREKKERTLDLKIDNHLKSSDEIKVSYTGSSIVSILGKKLDTFSELTIKNDLPVYSTIPAKIEAEDYINMQGLVKETTTDEDGGFNLGFTDFGDFADYRVFVEKEGEYLLNLRLAGESQMGSLGFYLVDENNDEEKLVTTATLITGGWQIWKTKSLKVFLPAGNHTIRMKVLAAGFNFNWFEISEIAPEVLRVESTINKDEAIFYPNPVKNTIHILNEKFDQFVILSLTGVRKLGGSILSNHTIQIANLHSGIYLLKVTDSKKRISTTKRMLVIK
ncbi:MAG: carbohydrate-binding protein [Cyclobacteriaceae bacterium]